MELNGERTLAADRDAVWQALNDPEILRQCILGCEEIERLSDDEMDAKVTAKFGPVKAKFAANIQLQEVNPPESYRLVGEGKGGVAGFAKGHADVRLEAITSESGAPATQLTYTADMQVGGKLAQVGSRLVSGTSNKIINTFFERFAEIVQKGA